jgi:predicted NBD/HSP70 family sugar kinase
MGEVGSGLDPEGRAILPASAHRGSNQSGMRAFNERLALSLVRRHGGIAKSEIARMTGLSAQTVSVIMRSLERDGLVVRGEPVRGKVGQPIVPLSLNPDGAYFMGLKIGRRSADFVLVDFCGNIHFTANETYAYPVPARILAIADSAIASCRKMLGAKFSRIAGLGVAMPHQLWNWAEEVGAPAEEIGLWRGFDIRSALAADHPWPIYIQNDATAACGAELALGAGIGAQDFVYFYVGTFAGGGVVLNGSLYAGRFGNAGALGSMPVIDQAGKPVQLIDLASLAALERLLNRAGIDSGPMWTTPPDWSGFADPAETWIAQAARALAQAIVAAVSVIDFEAVVIDGGFPADIRTRLVAATQSEIGNFDLQGIVPPSIKPGTIGPISRALGGACLPLFDRYLIDQNMLMRES